MLNYQRVYGIILPIDFHIFQDSYKPPTRKWTVRITCSGYCSMWCVLFACAEKNLPAFPTCLAQGPNFPPLLTHIWSGSPKPQQGPLQLTRLPYPSKLCLGMFGSARRSSSTTGKISCSTNTWSRRRAFGILMSPSALDNDGTVLIAADYQISSFSVVILGYYEPKKQAQRSPRCFDEYFQYDSFVPIHQKNVVLH